MKSILIVIFSVPIMYLSPFFLVLFHFCMGKYSIDSWFFYYPIWWVCAIGEGDSWLHFFFLNHRTPFEQNTATRCAAIVLFEALIVSFVLSVICVVICLFLSSMLYVKGCLLDIKSILLAINRLSKHENSESLMVGCCKDAVDLHERVNRYFLHFNNLSLVPNSFSSISFKIHASTGRINKPVHFLDGHTLGNVHMFLHVHYRQSEEN